MQMFSQFYLYFFYFISVGYSQPFRFLCWKLPQLLLFLLATIFHPQTSWTHLHLCRLRMCPLGTYYFNNCVKIDRTDIVDIFSDNINEMEKIAERCLNFATLVKELENVSGGTELTLIWFLWCFVLIVVVFKVWDCLYHLIKPLHEKTCRNRMMIWNLFDHPYILHSQTDKQVKLNFLSFAFIWFYVSS